MKGAMHVAPHDVPLHVGLVLGGVGHGVHDEPHAAALVLLAHEPLQA
jgi:hypothetical protein